MGVDKLASFKLYFGRVRLAEPHQETNFGVTDSERNFSSNDALSNNFIHHQQQLQQRQRYKKITEVRVKIFGRTKNFTICQTEYAPI